MTGPNPPSKTYWVGGAPPYGWTGTPAYNPFQVPTTSDTGITGETMLYERLDWTGGVSADDLKKEFQNPPFIGIGSSSARVPQWMQGDNPAIPHRILRGYMRRQGGIYTLPNAVNATQQGTNARLFFMFNPGSINRVYQSTDSLMNALNPTNSPTGPDQANISFVSITSVTFELMFDRQEEVSRFPNHPGVLVDLAVFDLLVRGGSPGQTFADPTKTDDTKYDPAAMAGISISGDRVTNSVSLVLDNTLPLVVIFSPNLAFYGNVTGADAYFDKFSHRMTPTRLRLMVTMRINAVGPSVQPTTRDGKVEAAAQTSKAAIAPGETAATDAKRDQMNADGRASAMAWAENWLPGKATPGGVLYDVNKRCQVQANDSLNEFSGIHVPLGFDCSAFVARSLAVIGWASALGLDPCADTNGFEKSAKDHGDVWDVYDFAARKASMQAGGQTSNMIYGEFNGKVQAGDLILRSGTGAAGHIVFVHQDLGGANDGTHKWEFLHSYSTGKPPALSTYTTAQITDGGGGAKPYSKRLRPQPVKTSKDVNNPATIGQTSGGSW